MLLLLAPLWPGERFAGCKDPNGQCVSPPGLGRGHTLLLLLELKEVISEGPNDLTGLVGSSQQTPQQQQTQTEADPETAARRRSVAADEAQAASLNAQSRSG